MTKWDRFSPLLSIPLNNSSLSILYLLNRELYLKIICDMDNIIQASQHCYVASSADYTYFPAKQGERHQLACTAWHLSYSTYKFLILQTRILKGSGRSVRQAHLHSSDSLVKFLNILLCIYNIKGVRLVIRNYFYVGKKRSYQKDD